MAAHNIDAKPRTQDIEINEDCGFESFLLSEKVLKGLTTNGFLKPSPIQLQAIPFGRVGLDLIVQAKSGTGKTCVFTVVALEAVLEESSAAQVLILAPTREIAVQIAQTVETIGSYFKGLKVGSYIGGLPLKKDETNLRKCQVVVGTPGRIRQLIELKHLSCSSIRLFVLDEADKLLEKSFFTDINWIYNSLPQNKQMITTSATYPEKLAKLLAQYMRSPQYIRLGKDTPSLLGISQYVRNLHADKKNELKLKLSEMQHILSTIPFNQCIVFCNYQTRVDTFNNLLKAEGWKSMGISASQEQEDRLHVLSNLKTFTCRILVSTDLTARGIDAENVNLVINIDVPRDVATYLHRIGRAGRYGSIATAITITSSLAERESLHKILKSSNSVAKVLPKKFKLEDLSKDLPDFTHVPKDVFSPSVQPKNKIMVVEQEAIKVSAEKETCASQLLKESGSFETVCSTISLKYETKSVLPEPVRFKPNSNLPQPAAIPSIVDSPDLAVKFEAKYPYPFEKKYLVALEEVFRDTDPWSQNLSPLLTTEFEKTVDCYWQQCEDAFNSRLEDVKQELDNLHGASTVDPTLYALEMLSRIKRSDEGIVGKGAQENMPVISSSNKANDVEERNGQDCTSIEEELRDIAIYPEKINCVSSHQVDEFQSRARSCENDLDEIELGLQQMTVAASKHLPVNIDHLQMAEKKFVTNRTLLDKECYPAEESNIQMVDGNIGYKPLRKNLNSGDSICSEGHPPYYQTQLEWVKWLQCRLEEAATVRRDVFRQEYNNFMYS